MSGIGGRRLDTAEQFSGMAAAMLDAYRPSMVLNLGGFLWLSRVVRNLLALVGEVSRDGI